MCETAYNLLVQNPEDQKSELVDLNHAPSVKNLPPAYIVTAEYDPLRDEGEYYAARLFKNNVPVSLLTVSCDVGAGPDAGAGIERKSVTVLGDGCNACLLRRNVCVPKRP